jgi:hypothetical protein
LRDPLPELARLRDRAPDERGCDARSRGAASDPTGLRSPLNGRCASRRSTWPAIKDQPRKRPPKCGTTFVSSATTRHDRAEHAELGINTQKSRSPAAALGRRKEAWGDGNLGRRKELGATERTWGDGKNLGRRKEEGPLSRAALPLSGRGPVARGDDLPHAHEPVADLSPLAGPSAEAKIQFMNAGDHGD